MVHVVLVAVEVALMAVEVVVPVEERACTVRSINTGGGGAC